MNTEKQRNVPLTKLPESTDTVALVALASQAQTQKIKEILNRMDAITQLDPARIKNFTDVIQSAVADGGCGIGCW